MSSDGMSLSPHNTTLGMRVTRVTFPWLLTLDKYHLFIGEFPGILIKCIIRQYLKLNITSTHEY